MKQIKGHLKIVIDKMAQYAGLENFDNVNPSEKDWFLKHSWTEKKQKEFMDWFADYLLDSKARKELLTTPSLKTKKHRQKCANEFIFNYGWKCQ